MSEIATAVGYIVLVGGGAALCLLALLAIWVWFPIRFDVNRNTPSQLLTPHGRFNISLLCCLSGRREPGWLFGLVLLDRGSAEDAS